MTVKGRKLTSRSSAVVMGSAGDYFPLNITRYARPRPADMISDARDAVTSGLKSNL